MRETSVRRELLERLSLVTELSAQDWDFDSSKFKYSGGQISSKFSSISLTLRR